MPIKIVVTGPESAGKTSLCTLLSGCYKSTMIPEYSREYLYANQDTYGLEDVEQIGITQNERNSKFPEDDKLIFCDTDALSCLVWIQKKFGVDSEKLKALCALDKPDLYLLCYPDLKWEYDVLRESPEDREEIFYRFVCALTGLKSPFVIVTGTGQQRLSNAIQLINNRIPDLVIFAF